MKPGTRVSIHPWRDPRLLLGIMLVLLSTVVGAKVFAAQDSTIAYWSVASSVVVGDQVNRDDLVQTRVRLASAPASHYVRVSEELPGRFGDLVWARSVEGGALLERSALAPAGARPAAELPLSVPNGAYPLDLRTGDKVDVWVGPGQGQPKSDASELVLKAARVLSTGGASMSLTSCRRRRAASRLPH